jgi:hypothetical protein
MVVAETDLPPEYETLSWAVGTKALGFGRVRAPRFLNSSDPNLTLNTINFAASFYFFVKLTPFFRPNAMAHNTGIFLKIKYRY